MLNPLRSALICNPTWRPDSASSAPFSLRSTMNCDPAIP
jgi:hypothetical protein